MDIRKKRDEDIGHHQANYYFNVCRFDCYMSSSSSSISEQCFVILFLESCAFDHEDFIAS